MFLDGTEITNYLNKIQKGNNVIILPSTIHIPYFLNRNIKIGIQNICINNITGEVSALQAKKIGVSYVLLGHSERRKYFNETNEEINLKIKEALIEKLNVILCISETLEERNNNLTKESLKRQLNECLCDINDEIIIAYEPTWSISSGIILPNKEIESVVEFIKELYPYKVLYGGSINKNNINIFEQVNNLDGYLIGNISSKVDEFNEIIKTINKK